MLEKIVRDNPDVQLIIKLLPFKGQSSVNAAKAALSMASAARYVLAAAPAFDDEKGLSR
jgi:hypothetical protein